MSKRKGISKRVRFEIFKRDLFTCRYCGKRPPDVLLEVDHVIPVAKGGANDDDNLVTSCDACNRGKSDVSLGNVVPAIDELTRLAAMQEVLERAVGSRQAVEVARVQAEADDDAIALICDWWESAFDSSDYVQPASLRTFLRRLSIGEIHDAIDATESRFCGYRSCTKVWLYFCGVCWRKIRENDAGDAHGS